jgi:hypothetical protein
MNTVAE